MHGLLCLFVDHGLQIAEELRTVVEEEPHLN